MNTRSFRLRRRANAFTLVEILVSVTVLGMIVVALAQMMNSAMVITIGGSKHIFADTQARMVFDRMAVDIANITKRPDVDYYFQKNTGNDQMIFFSQSGGYYPTGITSSTQGSNFSLVGYRINSNNQLERLSKALVWNGVTPSSSYSPMVYLPQTIAATWPKALGSTTGSDPDYQVIGDQVFRLEFSFLVENSSNSAVLSANPYLTPDTSINGLQDVVAIVVSIAVLDSQSQKTLSGTALQSAALQLPDVTGTTVLASGLPATTWQAQLLTNNLGLPNAAASQVRFYQRYFFLNHLQ